MLITAVIVVVGCVWMFRRSQAGVGAAPLVLAVLPFALLLLAVPVPLVAFETIRHFQALGEGGSPPLSAAQLAYAMMQPLWLGAIGFVITVGLAAGMQVLQGPETERTEEGVRDVRPTRGWATAVFTAPTALLIPAGWLTFFLRDVATLIRQLANAGPTAMPPTEVAGLPLSEVSRVLAAKLLTAAIGGTSLVCVVAAFAVGGLLLFRRQQATNGLRRVSWVITALALGCAAWITVALTVSMRSASGQ